MQIFHTKAKFLTGLKKYPENVWHAIYSKLLRSLSEFMLRHVSVVINVKGETASH